MEEEDGYLVLEEHILGDSGSGIVVKEQITAFRDIDNLTAFVSVKVEDKDGTEDLTDEVVVIDEADKGYCQLGGFSDTSLAAFGDVWDGLLLEDSLLCLICQEPSLECITLTRVELDKIKEKGYIIGEGDHLICPECYNAIVSVEHPGICERCGKEVKTRMEIDAFSVEEYEACRDRISLGDGDGDQAAQMEAYGGVDEFAADEVEECYHNACYTAYLCSECYDLAIEEVLGEEEEAIEGEGGDTDV